MNILWVSPVIFLYLKANITKRGKGLIKKTGGGQSKPGKIACHDTKRNQGDLSVNRLLSELLRVLKKKRGKRT